MAILDYQAIKFEGTSSENRLDALTVEEGLQVKVNGEPLMITMRSPGNDAELVRGLLHSEDILPTTNEDVEIIVESKNKQGIVPVVNVNIPEDKLGDGYKNSRSFLSVSSCGICGQTELQEVKGELEKKGKFNPLDLKHMFELMDGKQKTFRKSGGSHSAAAFDEKGEMICVMEDIGRHNAVDKVIGTLLLKKQLNRAFAITVSGRISYEIVMKAFRAKIPVLAAVSAPSSLAVDYSKELGITLFGFCRGENATCYSNMHRVNPVDQTK